MKRPSTLAFFCTLFTALVGCVSETTSISSGSFNVDGNIEDEKTSAIIIKVLDRQMIKRKRHKVE